MVRRKASVASGKTASPEAIENRTARRARMKKRGQAALSGALALGVVGTGLLVGPSAAMAGFGSGGGAGPGGGGGGGGGDAGVPELIVIDDDQNRSNPGQASIDRFNNLVLNGTYGISAGYWNNGALGATGATSNLLGAGNNNPVQAACSTAIANAQAAYPDDGPARVIMLGFAVGGAAPGWGSNKPTFQSAITAGAMQGLQGWSSADMSTAASVYNGSIPDNDPRIVCVATNSQLNYKLTVATDKSANVPVTAGSRVAIHDTVHTTAGGSAIRENVNVSTTLNWRGPEGNTKQATKAKAMPNQGSTQSAQFTPADFGWHSWPAGKFWFSADVAQQGKMDAAVSHNGENDARQNFSPKRDETVVKKITSGPNRDEVANDEVFAAEQFYNAEITAATNGYSSRMTIIDTIKTDKVFVGAKDADLASAVYVLDPEGNKVANATININRGTAGQVQVSGAINSIPDKFQSRDYTLVVPTYFLATGADYSVPDDSRACYTASVNECMEGNSEIVRKVTPKPDKVWVLDEEGALAEADPNHTNQEGADEKTFLQNDEVAAVVNGRVPGKLAEPLTNYQLVDDWSNAAPYIDFNDAAKANVFIETAPGSGKYTKVTSDFDITVADGVTTATAKAGSNFLTQTKGQSADRKTKLVISGQFRDDYDTNGELVKMVNKGHEIWNNERIDTNVPPIFTWTPDPNKEVIGSSEESGDNTYDSIDGMSVFPGQKLEYTIGLDLQIPEDTARGVKSLGVLDTYDPMFEPDKTSVQFFDGRDPKNPRPIPAKFYKLTFDDATNSFRADFTQEWIDQNVNVEGANSEWQTKGWLTMRFTGTVKKDAAPGSTVENQAFQIINEAMTKTETPVVKIPEQKPDKENINKDTLEDIDGKTVVQGDHILYRLTLDARPGKDELAYNVHKLGMVDDFDEEYLDLTVEGITVKNKATGEDVTDAFNIQIIDGKAYIFAKQVDSVNYFGEEIPGDPQPEDLAAYSEAAIEPHKTPLIDQDLLGHEYSILLDTVVSKELNDYTIYNEATQNIQNTWTKTKIVSNPLKDIDPDKDVVVSEETKDNSINEAEVKLYSDFNYRLNSSEIPANRAYKASQWSLSDTFDRTHDEYTGIWAIYANNDIYLLDELIFKKGDLLADSAGHQSELANDLFDVTFDDASYTINVEVKENYLNLINSRMDLANSFSVYTKMIRIAPGDKIENQVNEKYNEVDRESNIVWTSTPENPSIDLEKYTLSEGLEKGDRDVPELALPLKPENLGAAKGEGEAGPEFIDVGFQITNNGDVPLKDVALSDVTLKDTFGSVKNISCEIPTPKDQADLIGPDAPKTIQVAPDKIGGMEVDQVITCVGQLQDMDAKQFHSNEGTVTGKSVFTDKEVTDKDQWHAADLGPDSIRVEKYTLDEGLPKGDRDTSKEALSLTPKQVKDGVKIGFQITNTGYSTLYDVKLTDQTHETTTGTVKDISCEAPEGQKKGESISLAPGQTVDCVGLLTGVKTDTWHGDTATATGKTKNGTVVKDSDPWFAKAGNPGQTPPPEKPAGPEKGAVTGQFIPSDSGMPLSLWAGIIVAALAALAGTAYAVNRKRRAQLLTEAGADEVSLK